MNGRLIGYLLLAAWASWLLALLGLAGNFGIDRAWLPNAVLCLVILIAATLPRSEAFQAALVLALASIAFSVDAPVAILASYLGAALFVRTMRAGVEVHAPLPRAILCMGFVWLDGMWLVGVRAQRAVFAAAGLPGAQLRGGDLLSAALEVLPRALSSGLLAFAFGGLLLRLPGLRLLERRRAF